MILVGPVAAGGTMLKITTTLALSALVLLGAMPSARAQACKAEDIFAIIDRTGQRLREIHGEAQPRLRAKLQELARKNGWAEADAETKGTMAFDDETTRSLDARAADLLADLDRLADVESGDTDVCRRLDEARTKSGQLIEVSQQRSSHVLARIDVALRPAPPAAPAAPPTAPPPPPAPAVAAAGPGVQPSATETPSRPRARAPAAPSWDTRTVRDAEPTVVAAEIQPAPLPPSEASALGFSPEEIRAAGRGFFGSISAGLASVIDHAFQRYGRPTGYILGDEGGGAFFAGLRYGQGRLVTKTQGERRVYWQGPSAGFDFGLAGSQVMFLVYNVEDHADMFQRFTGIDGSAYLVGGVGITFLKRGKVTLAPIRTGLGLRVGANVGYLKFTPSPSINPF
jgi:hypothetical protein